MKNRPIEDEKSADDAIAAVTRVQRGIKAGAQASGTPRNSLGVVPALSYCVPREQKQTGQTQVSLSLVGHGRRFGGIRSR